VWQLRDNSRKTRAGLNCYLNTCTTYYTFTGRYLLGLFRCFSFTAILRIYTHPLRRSKARGNLPYLIQPIESLKLYLRGDLYKKALGASSGKFL
jgi:hypothetical protein